MTGIPNIRDLAVKDKSLFFFNLKAKYMLILMSIFELWTLTFKASKINPVELQRNGNKMQSLSLGWLWPHTRGIVWLCPVPPWWQRILRTDRQTDSGQTLLLCPIHQPESPGGCFSGVAGIMAVGKRIRLGRQTVGISALQWIQERPHFTPDCTFPPSPSLPK